MALAAKRSGIKALYVPADSAAEATLAEGPVVYPVENVRQLAAHLAGEELIAPAPLWQPGEETARVLDFADVKGQEPVKRALEIAAAGGLDLQLLGIGFNGHIAFNEPMGEDEISVEEFGALPTRVLPLSRATIDQNTRLTAGGDESLMPKYAATMGMAPILAAKKCLLLACFAEQEAPLRAIFAKSAPTPFLPASYLWRHPDYHLIYTTDKISLG